MELKNLDFAFGDVSLFKNLSLKIETGKITTLLGPSGCGKSTLLRIFAEILPVKNKPSVFMKENSTESFVFQEACLLEWKTGFKNIMLPFEISKKEVDQNHFEQVIQALKIKEVLNL